jgi:integrase
VEQGVRADRGRLGLANPITKKPYFPTEIQSDISGLPDGVWWSARSAVLVRASGAPMKVQQELMRHASIQTTMNVHGQAMSSSKREANGKVVEMVLKPMKASA